MGIRGSGEAIDRLGGAAVRVAAVAGVKYLRVHGLTSDPDAFAACLTAHVKAATAIPGALADARAALEAVMGQDGNRLAEQTFLASMALAGIEAAKEAGFPPALVGRS